MTAKHNTSFGIDASHYTLPEPSPSDRLVEQIEEVEEFIEELELDLDDAEQVAPGDAEDLRRILDRELDRHDQLLRRLDILEGNDRD